MKGLYLWMLCILFLAMLLLPLLALGPADPNGGDLVSQSTPADLGTFTVYFPQTKTTQTLSAHDYLLGVLAAEMSADCHPEALKAQAVASYTFALYRQQARRAAGEAFDLVADTSDQVYITPKESAQKWGNKTAENTQKVEAAIAAVAGYWLCYEGEPILSVFHAISAGKTESANILWGGNYPYLQPADSICDLLAAGYQSEQKVSAEDFRQKAEALGCQLTGEPETWLSEPKRSDSGTVTEYVLGGKALTGTQLREAFLLRSPHFDLRFAQGEFVFLVRGYGHGVGMSQYGANYMAEQGSDFAEILNHYYTGCELKKP